MAHVEEKECAGQSPPFGAQEGGHQHHAKLTWAMVTWDKPQPSQAERTGPSSALQPLTSPLSPGEGPAVPAHLTTLPLARHRKVGWQ